MANILVVDDEKDIRDLLGDIVEDEGHEATKVGHAQDAIDQVDQSNFDLVILDIWLKESKMDGIDILKYIKTRHPELPVVIISGHGNIEIAVAAIRQGAFDYIEKPFNVDQLLVVVERALETSQLRQEARKLKQESDRPSEIIGSSNEIKTLRAQLDKIAKAQSRVLFLGPTGSGKELAARYLHNHSDRAARPFVTLSAASEDEADMDSLLFGREENGKVYQGTFERAQGGTLYIDEIADIPKDVQAKILRVINDGRVERIGSNQAISLDVRVLSATKHEPEQLIQTGAFREELYHRLAVTTVYVPALSEHVSDIAELAAHFVERFIKEQGLTHKAFAPAAIEALETLPWNGNVREFRNRIEQLMIAAGDEDEIGADAIIHADAGVDEESLSPQYLLLPLREAREVFEQRYLKAQIKRFANNISRTANFIGMERSALHRKMKSLNIHTNSDKKSDD